MKKIKLDVPYFSQRDSKVPGQARRMCASSSAAMLAEYLKPGVLAQSGEQPDDVHLKNVLAQGDTTDPQLQSRILNGYGLKTAFQTQLSWAVIDQQLELGVPVPIGILHHGHVSSPYGGGHWIVVVGRDEAAGIYLVHDPNGELNLVAGGYRGAGESGAFLGYSKKNLDPRWRVGGSGGWGILAQPTRTMRAPKEPEAEPRVPLLVVLEDEREIHIPFSDKAGLSVVKAVLEELSEAGQPIAVGWQDRDGGRLYLRRK